MESYYRGRIVLCAAMWLMCLSTLAASKLCCDSEQAIFYGRTVESHVSREPEFLLYPDSGQEEEGFHSHGYNCREDFIPPPGYENSWVRSVQVQTREMILNSLPEEWARWVCTNRPMLGIVTTSILFISIIIPLLFLHCQSCLGSRKKDNRVQTEIVARRKCEDKLKVLEATQGTLERQAREAKESFSTLSEDLRLITINWDKLVQEKGSVESQNQAISKNLEVQLDQYLHNSEQLQSQLADLQKQKRSVESHNQVISKNLEQAKEQLDQYLRNSEQLQSQLTGLQQQQAAILLDKDRALEQNSHLKSVIADQKHMVQGMEAQKDQLEHDIFITRTTLEKLKAEHEQVLNDYQSERDNVDVLTGNLEEQQEKEAALEEEIITLKNCLQEVVDGVCPPSEGGEENGCNEEIEKDHEVAKEFQLEKIEVMLDTSKMQIQLREAEEQRDQFMAEVERVSSDLEEQNYDVDYLNNEVTTLKDQLREIEIKENTLSGYFKQKELELHSKLEAGEYARRQFEGYLSGAEEKEKAREADREQWRKEVENLRVVMKDIEASYLGQAKSHEKRAEECASQLRHAEQELRQTHREITMYKKRVAELESAMASSAMVRPIPQNFAYSHPPMPRPPSAGPPPYFAPPGLARPISAPRLSPGGFSEGPPPMRNGHPMMNTSLPSNARSGPMPRPQSRGSSYEGHRMNVSADDMRRSIPNGPPPGSSGPPPPAAGGPPPRPALGGSQAPPPGGRPPSGGSQAPPPGGKPPSGVSQAPPPGAGGRPPSGGSQAEGRLPSGGSQAPPPGAGGIPPSGGSQAEGRLPSGGSQAPPPGARPPSGGSQAPPPGGRPPSGGSQAPPPGGRPPSGGSQAPPHGGRPPSGGSQAGGRLPLGGSHALPPEGRPPSSGSPPGGRPPSSGSPPGGRPPSGGSQAGGRLPLGGSQALPPEGRPPSSGSPPGGRPPSSGSPPGGRPPSSGSPPGGRPPSSGSPPGGRPPSGESQAGGRLPLGTGGSQALPPGGRPSGARGQTPPPPRPGAPPTQRVPMYRGRGGPHFGPPPGADYPSRPGYGPPQPGYGPPPPSRPGYGPRAAYGPPPPPGAGYGPPPPSGPGYATPPPPGPGYGPPPPSGPGYATPPPPGPGYATPPPPGPGHGPPSTGSPPPQKAVQHGADMGPRPSSTKGHTPLAEPQFSV